ncbi:MAG: asparagine synthase-related protein, partial [Planctomycetaceae bacterium]
DRAKAGFGVPIDSWVRGPLRAWAEAVLREEGLKREGYLSAAPIGTKWQQHLAGDADWQYLLWDVLMFEAWLDAN